MIALDSSSVIAYLSGEHARDVTRVQSALDNEQAVLPPVVVAELLSDPSLDDAIAQVLLAIPVLQIHEGYWERAGRLRARMLARGLKARLADSLIAQSCIDHRVPPVTRDRDFQRFIREGLRLAEG